ncbi:MAG: zf-HC2 domain-containing protein, partial [Deltaproteobacteria bacterium]|nr:zf-HC2 domain-containing protein [Kofleriaceae bacterium]
MPDPCAVTARYFDGELAPADEAAAIEHLAGCARCQAELGDLAGIDVALRRERVAEKVSPAPPATPSR